MQPYQLTYKFLGLLTGISFFWNLFLAGAIVVSKFFVGYQVSNVLWFAIGLWAILTIACIIWKTKIPSTDYKTGALILGIVFIIGLIPTIAWSMWLPTLY